MTPAAPRTSEGQLLHRLWHYVNKTDCADVYTCGYAMRILTIEEEAVDLARKEGRA